MTDYLDQLEFRWQSDYDLSVIAASDPEGSKRWDQLLRNYVGMPDEQPGAHLPTSSAVYHTTEKGEAALVLRFEMPHARRVSERADPGRHKLVARVLVGNARVLTPDLALCLACSPLSDLLGTPLGEVTVSTRLPAVSAAQLWAEVEDKKNELSNKCKLAPGLPRLITARLEQPAGPLNVLLEQAEVLNSLYGTPAIPLLWGLFQTTRRLVEGTVPADHWNTTFTTFEPPFREAEGRRMPQIVFQGAAGRRPPAFTQVSLLHAPAEPGRWDGFANGLAVAYAELGADLDHYLKEVAAQSSDLSQRADLLMRQSRLARCWTLPRERYELLPPAERSALPQASPDPRQLYQAASHAPPAVPPAVPPAKPATQFSEAAPGQFAAPASHQSHPENPSVSSTGPFTVPYGKPTAGIELRKLYNALDASVNEPWFGEVLLLLVAKTRGAHVLPDEHYSQVLGRFRANTWYLDQLHQRYGKSKAINMLGLIFLPVLEGLLQNHPSMFWDTSLWRDLPSEAREAMCMARAQISDEKGGLLLEEFLFRLLREPLPASPHTQYPEPMNRPPALGPIAPSEEGIPWKAMAITASALMIVLLFLLIITR